MKVQLKIEMGALNGERVCNATDEQGEIKGTLSVFLNATKDKVYFTGNAEARVRFAHVIVEIAEMEQWADAGVHGALEHWADMVMLEHVAELCGGL